MWPFIFPRRRPQWLGLHQTEYSFQPSILQSATERGHGDNCLTQGFLRWKPLSCVSHTTQSISLELKIVTTTLMSINEYATTTNLDTRMQFLLKSSGSSLSPNGTPTIYICTATRIEATSVKKDEFFQ